MSNDINVKIIIATHKKYRMPDDSMYIPLQVGADCMKDENGKALDLGYAKDNEGENISARNRSFCELTGLYWAWKNLDADYIGLVHYRRHFSMYRRKNRWDSILTREDLEPTLGKVRLYIPNKRKYYIETLYSHYDHTHYSYQLDKARKIMEDKYPEYIDSFDPVVQSRYGYMFNMMIMDKALLDDYCSWLFDILFELDKLVDVRELSAYQRRYFGRISEIIFNVWLDHKIKSGELNTDEVKNIKCVHMERINWFKKGRAFLRAKFFKQKYEGSF